MGDFDKVSAGQKFKPKAKAWNAFIDAALYVKNQQNGMTSDTGKRQARAGIVLVHNTSDDDMPVFAPMYISGPIVEVEDDESALKFMDGIPAFTADKFSEEEDLEKPLVILQQPIKSDEMGKALIAGITPVRLTSTDKDGDYAVPDLEDSTGMATAASGNCRILWQGDGDDSWAIVQVNVSAAVEYDGPFKIINGDSGIEVVDGRDPDANYAGFAMGNGELTSIESGSVSGFAPGYVCLQAKFDEDEEPFTWSFLITEYPETEVTETTAIYPLGYLEADDDGGIAKIIQFHHAVPQLWVLGECKADESASS